MTTDLNWERYRTFLAVLTEGSLSGAARALGITQPTAGRHVAALEAAFGQTLFTRSPSGLLPTEAALALRGLRRRRSAAAAFERAAASHGAGV
ncbi:helix-turn-helix domain-containing protein, partial [Burkholderia ubonensis]|uniref:helix-turn-helix domain-containing protein n=1 Tax=Burkholderia ubonensis TaxID=101571 RepID=UPI000B07E196